MTAQIGPALAQRVGCRGALKVCKPCVGPLGNSQSPERLLTSLLSLSRGDSVGVLPGADSDGRLLRGEPDLRLALRRECVRR